MPVGTKLADSIREQVEFIGLSKLSLAGDAEGFQQVVDAPTKKIGMENAQHDSFLTATASAILKLIGDSQIPQHDRGALIQQVISKVSNVRVNGHAVRQPMQSCLCFYNYMDMQEWALITDPTKYYERKLAAVIAAAKRIGLVAPNEATKTLIASIIIVAMCAGDPLSCTASDCFRIVHDVKELFQKEQRLPKLYHSGKVIMFPARPEQLSESHPDVYKTAYPTPEDQPLKCPLETGEIQLVHQRTPARCTHSAIATPLRHRALLSVLF